MDLVGMPEAPARRGSLEARALVALARARVIGIDSPGRMLPRNPTGKILKRELKQRED